MPARFLNHQQYLVARFHLVLLQQLQQNYRNQRRRPHLSIYIFFTSLVLMLLDVHTHTSEIFLQLMLLLIDYIYDPCVQHADLTHLLELLFSESHLYLPIAEPDDQTTPLYLSKKNILTILAPSMWRMQTFTGYLHWLISKGRCGYLWESTGAVEQLFSKISSMLPYISHI